MLLVTKTNSLLTNQTDSQEDTKLQDNVWECEKTAEVIEESELEQRSKFFNHFFAAILTMGSFYRGWSLNMHNIMGFYVITENYPDINHEDAVVQFGDIHLFALVGVMGGSIVAGIVTTHIGKVKAILIGELFHACGFTCMFFMKTTIWLFAASAFFQGLMISVNQVTTLRTLKEIAPKSVLNFGGIIPIAFQIVGSLAATSIGNIVDKKLLARNAYLVFPSLVFFSIIRVITLVFYFRVESPVWVIEKYARKINDLEEGIIQKYDNNEFTNSLKGEKFILDEKNTKWVRQIHERIYSKKDMLKAEYLLVKDMDEHFSKTSASFTEVFKPYWRKAFIICLCLHSQDMQSGHAFFAQYSTIVFDSIEPGSGTIVTLAISCFTIVIVPINWWIQKKHGRRPALLAGSFLELLGFIILAVFVYCKFYWVLMILPVFMNYLGFVIGMGVIAGLYISEVMPAYGLAAISFIDGIVSIGVTKYTPIFLDKLGPLWMMLFYSCVCLCAVIFIWAYCPEIKNKNKEQIHLAFKNV